LVSFKEKLNKNMKLPASVKAVMENLPSNQPSMSHLRTCLSMLGEYDREAEKNNAESNDRKAVRIMSAMPVIVAALQRIKNKKDILSSKKSLSFAGNFLYMLKGEIPTKEEENVLDTCLVLHAEHGLNASTFASRVTVSTLSDLYSGMVSAVGTLKGPLHGGANFRAIENLHKLAKKLKVKDVCVEKCLDEVDEYVQELLKKHIKIMGIGHRVYKVKDPRAKVLEKYASKIGKRYIKYYQMAKEIEKVMALEKELYPNVDFFSGMVYENLGIKMDIYVCLFALSRTSGWIAHMMEQYNENKIIRPRALYTGHKQKNFIRIENRE